MAPPAAPAWVDLFGADAAEKERSREATRLRLDWAPSAGATAYEVEAAGVLRALGAGGWVEGLEPARQTVVTLFARNADGASPPSSVTLRTRPPTPAAPIRAPVDLGLWQVVLGWSVDTSFDPQKKAVAILERSLGGGPFQERTRVAALVAATFTDGDDPQMRPKRYRLVVELDGDFSRPGPELSASGPIFVRALRPSQAPRRAVATAPGL